MFKRPQSQTRHPSNGVGGGGVGVGGGLRKEACSVKMGSKKVRAREAESV